MNILLLTRRWFKKSADSNPIAVLDLSAYLRALGHVVDCYYIDEIPYNPGKKYDVVGLSVFTDFNNHVRRDALYLKKKFRDSQIVLGGKWAKSFITDSDCNLFRQNGINVWQKSGEEYFTGSKAIDFNGYPSWDPKDTSTLHLDGNNIQTSRGCPFRCTFCNNTEKAIIFFPCKRTADNVEAVFKTRAKNIFFCDDIFTLDAQRMINIYDECKRRNVDIENKNYFFSHVNFINEGVIKAASYFKPSEIQVGLESGDDRILKLMQKQFNAEVAYERIKSLYEGLQSQCGQAFLNGLFIVGFPGENMESINNTIKFVKRIKRFLSKIWVSYYNPVPHTVGYDLSKSHGVILNKRQDNTVVNYIDSNLTRKKLVRARTAILQAFS